MRTYINFSNVWVSCEKSHIMWSSAIPGIWGWWLRESFWIPSISADCRIAGSSHMHSETIHYFSRGCSLWAVPYFCTCLSLQPLSQNEQTLLAALFPSSITPFLLSPLTEQIPWKKKVLFFFLFSGTGFPFPLTFIISTGNANFTLHILTPLRKLYT